MTIAEPVQVHNTPADSEEEDEPMILDNSDADEDYAQLMKKKKRGEARREVHEMRAFQLDPPMTNSEEASKKRKTCDAR
jgi:hypothetical protein